MLRKYSILILFVFMAASLAFAEESISISTYYPSPYGSYYNLTASNNVTLANVTGSMVGIGTNTPKTKLEVSGQIYQNSTGTVMIFKSPDGSCSGCGPNNSDVWSCSSVSCP
ncbi:MAG: hypothetical protein ABIH27_06555 [Candidatus Omnitrophota bacterium]